MTLVTKNQREHVVKVFNDLSDSNKIGQKIELPIFKQFGNNLNEYRIQVRRIVYALFINLKKIKRMRDISLLPSLNDKQLTGIEVKKKTKDVCWGQIIEEKFSDLFITGYECSKCKSNRVISECKQTRSADEGVTVFLICLESGKKVRIN